MSNFKTALTRIYTTKGNPHVDPEGIYPKFRKVGLLINKKIHWLDFNFSEIHELNLYLRQLNIFLTPDGKQARYLEHGDHNTFNDDEDVYIPVTKISKSDYYIFSDESPYMKRSQPSEKGLMWHVQDVKQTYL